MTCHRALLLPLLLVPVLLVATTVGAEAYEIQASEIQRSPVPTHAAAAAPVGSAYYRSARTEIRRWTDWNVRLTLPAWIPGVTGTFANLDSGSGSDRERFEVDSSLVFALVGRVELRRGRWGLLLDGFTATITEDIRFTPTGTNVLAGEIKAILAHGDVSYQLGERWVRIGGRETRVRATLYAGVRYNNVHLKVDRVFNAQVEADTRREWFDPTVGLRFDWDLSRKLALHLEGDVGGFGIESEIAYWASFEVQWRFNSWLAASLGYTALHFEREFTLNGTIHSWGLTLHGPMVTLSARF